MGDILLVVLFLFDRSPVSLTLLAVTAIGVQLALRSSDMTMMFLAQRMLASLRASITFLPLRDNTPFFNISLDLMGERMTIRPLG